MKAIIIFLTIQLMLLASGERLSVRDALYFDKAQKQPFISNPHYEQRMLNLAKIDRTKATYLVEHSIKEPCSMLKLDVMGNYLIYEATTQNYKVILNALDGSIIKKEHR